MFYTFRKWTETFGVRKNDILLVFLPVDTEWHKIPDLVHYIYFIEIWLIYLHHSIYDTVNTLGVVYYSSLS